jgi:hypothetical protein
MGVGLVEYEYNRGEKGVVRSINGDDVVYVLLVLVVLCSCVCVYILVLWLSSSRRLSWICAPRVVVSSPFWVIVDLWFNVACSLPFFGAGVVSRDYCSLFISLHGAGVASRGCCELMSNKCFLLRWPLIFPRRLTGRDFHLGSSFVSLYC